MRTLLILMGKDLRLLWRDRAGLVFLTLAPIVVITVAGFSLANLYGADPTGQTAYEFPIADEDGSALAHEIHERLAREAGVRLRPVESRSDVEARVRRKRAGAGLVIPPGTGAALEAGKPASLVLYTDSVKYLESTNVRTRLLELREALAREERDRLSLRSAEQRQRLVAELERLHDAVSDARARLDATWQDAARRRREAVARARATLARASRDAESEAERALARIEEEQARTLRTELDAWRAPLRLYLDTLRARRAELEAWLAELERLAGRRAASIPPPPSFPEPPQALTRLLEEDLPLPAPPAASLLGARVPALDLPPLPPPPEVALPEVALPEPPAPPGSLELQEIDVSGGTGRINTFDQNVPGFSVTFLLLGMLLGVSLGLLDEREWGTFERLRTMPVPIASVLGGKLLSRFAVGCVQMGLLLLVGWLVFGVSLGPQPWTLFFPVVGIVFAGTAFGVIVAAVVSSREAVLPVGSIAIVTMAAVGGCWWPIDLEPRWMRSVALAFPTTWAMDAFNDLMIRHRPSDAAWRPTAVMLGYGVLYLAIGLAVFTRSLHRRPAR